MLYANYYSMKGIFDFSLLRMLLTDLIPSTLILQYIISSHILFLPDHQYHYQFLFLLIHLQSFSFLQILFQIFSQRHLFFFFICQTRFFTFLAAILLTPTPIPILLPLIQILKNHCQICFSDHFLLRPAVAWSKVLYSPDVKDEPILQVSSKEPSTSLQVWTSRTGCS